MIAGSIKPGATVPAGGSSTIKSLMSLARKIIYSKTSSRAATLRSAGLSSVPKLLTEMIKINSQSLE